MHKSILSKIVYLPLLFSLTACNSNTGTTTEKSTTTSNQNDINTISNDQNVTSIRIVPSAASIPPGGSASLNVYGGSAPYSYNVTPSNCGQMSGNIFIAPTDKDCVASIGAIDSNGNSAFTSISVATNIILVSNPNPVIAGQSATLTASGGLAPYTYSVTSSSGAIIENENEFIAQTAGEYTVTVQDNNGKKKSLKIKVTSDSPLAISPTTATAHVDGAPVPFQISGGRPPYKVYVYSGDGSFTKYGDYNANYYPSASTGSVKLVVKDADGLSEFADVVVKSSVLKEECVKVITPGMGNRSEYGSIVTVNGKSVCKIAQPSTASGSKWTQNMDDVKCPEGWDPVVGTNGNYTITYGQVALNYTSYWGAASTVTTKSHSSFASITRESEKADYCSGRNFFGSCKSWESIYPVVRYLACVPNDSNPAFL